MIYYFKKLAANPFFAGSLIICFLFFSCAKDSAMVDSKNKKEAKYSGKDIFNGLFFFQNEISSNITFLKQYNSKIDELKSNTEVRKELKNISDITTKYIDEKYPTFFSNLQNKIYSGDLYEINKQLNLSAQLIEQALLSNDKYANSVRLGLAIGKDEVLLKKAQALDLSTSNGQKEFKLLAASSPNKTVDTKKAMFFAAAVAVAYLGAAVVSIAVAAYSVVTKVAYWDPTQVAPEVTVEPGTLEPEPFVDNPDPLGSGAEVSITKGQAITEINSYFQNVE